jgi:hypothetical protein
VNKETFHFEIQDLLIQFLAAFDNVVITRFNDRSRVPGQKVQVRYIYAPKQRVLFDLINPGQNITLPVVSITISSITRDENRIFNKNAGFLTPAIKDNSKVLQDTPYFRSPVPVNIGVNMSILAKNQLDMDQILSNFIPYNNPYIIISWELPKAFSPNYSQEIRTEVLWDGNVSLTYPVELNGNQKAQIIADTNFTIKGWLFPFSDGPIKNIFKIDASLYAVPTELPLNIGSRYFSPENIGIGVKNNEIFYNSTASVTGFPDFTHVTSEVS